jgi:uncharacterized membrane protein
MIEVTTQNNPLLIRIVLTPNRSISWPLLLRFYLFTCLLSFSIAGLFTLLGYWIVLPFSGLEMMALGLGLYFASRKIYRQEVITIDKVNIKIEKGHINPVNIWVFDSHWVNIETEKTKGYRNNIKIMMGSHGKYIELGSFLTKLDKESLVFELNKGILFRGLMGRAG